MSTQQATVTLETLASRVEEMERREQEHAREVADLKREIVRLRAERGSTSDAADEQLARSVAALERRSTNGHRQRPERTSRRTLLQLGGAAAAATVGAGVLLNEQGGTALAAPQHVASAPYEGDATGAGNWGLKGAGTSGADGVQGTSDSGTGVVGASGSNIGGYFSGGRAPLQLALGTAPGAPTSGAHAPGSIYLDNGAVVWVCVEGGTPGFWKQVVAVPNGPTATLLESATGGGNVAIEGDGSSGADGVHGMSDVSVGVTGLTTSGTGVLGQASSGTGVVGQSTSANGVFGGSGSGTGVVGSSASGFGTAGGSTTGIGGYFFGGLAPLFLGLAGAPGAPTSGMHNAGEIYLDSTAVMWICVTTGTPGSWMRLTGVANGPIGGAITFASNASFVPTPIRLLDTRVGGSAATTPGAPIQPGAAHTFHLPVAGVAYNPGTGTVTIPANAKGLVGNCTVVNPAGVGDLAVYPDGQSLPNTAVMHYLAGQIVSNGITIGLGTNGHLAITALSAATDVIIDCQGFLV